MGPGSGFSPTDLNLFAYVANSPVHYVDPLGLDRLVFDGIALYWLLDDARILRRWPANSGVVGSSTLRKITRGVYKTSPEHREYKEPFDAWGAYAYRLIPLYDTGERIQNERTHLPPSQRGGFFIHGGKHAGTSGCVELAWGIDQAQIEEFHYLIQNYAQPIRLYVDYDVDPLVVYGPNANGTTYLGHVVPRGT